MSSKSLKTSNFNQPEKLTKALNLLKIAKVSKTHGLKGELFIRPFNQQSQWPKLTFVYLIPDSSKTLDKFDNFISNLDPLTFIKVGDPIFFEKNFRPDPNKILTLEVTSYSPHKEGFIFKFHGIDAIEQASHFKNFLVFVDRDLFTNPSDETLYLLELLNFQVFVKFTGQDASNLKDIGRVQSFQSNKYQDYLLVASSENKSSKEEGILIPFVSDYIQKIDVKKQELFLDLPEDFPGIEAKKTSIK